MAKFFAYFVSKEMRLKDEVVSFRAISLGLRATLLILAEMESKYTLTTQYAEAQRRERRIGAAFNKNVPPAVAHVNGRLTIAQPVHCLDEEQRKSKSVKRPAESETPDVGSFSCPLTRTGPRCLFVQSPRHA